MSDDGMDMVEIVVPVASLVVYGSPLDGEEWGCEPIAASDVREAVASGRLERESWQAVNRRTRYDGNFDHRRFHVERMACLLAEPVLDPVEIVIEGRIDGFGDGRCPWIADGNHRLGAAIVAGDDEISARVPSHDVADLMDLLPDARVVGLREGMAP